MKDFRKLQVWEKAHQLALSVYAVSKGFPKEELFGVTSQLRRSAASVPTNIAEAVADLRMQISHVSCRSLSAPHVKLIIF